MQSYNVTYRGILYKYEPLKELTGYNFAVEYRNYVFVSPAVYYLTATDDDLGSIIFPQLNVYNQKEFARYAKDIQKKLDDTAIRNHDKKILKALSSTDL